MENTQNMIIRLKSDEDKLTIPWTPDSIEISGNETRVAEYEIINKGQFQVPSGRNLRSVSWESTFPGESHLNLPFLNAPGDEDILSPIDSINIFEKWRKKGIVVNVLIYETRNDVTTTYFDQDCILGDYSGTFAGGAGDIQYSVTFTEYREITIKEKETSGGGGGSTIPKTHKVKKGETLHSISVKYWKNGSKKNSLYKWNKKVIEKAAKKHGKKSSKKGKYLYAGTVLKLYNPNSSGGNKKAYTGTFPKLPKRGYFKKGDNGTQVKNLQKFLNWYGGYKLKVDGKLGDKTVKAIKKFQKAVGLKQTGKFDSKALSKAKSVKK